MENIKYFIESSIKDDAEHNDEYHDNLEYIAGNDAYLSDFIEAFKNSVPLFNRKNILVVVSMLLELIEYQAKLDSLYPVILELMYKEYCYDWSISPRFAKILIKIRGEDISVFKDIVGITDENNTTSVSISVCSLYSNYPNFEGIAESIISRFLEKIYTCFINNKGCNDLRHAIATNLLPILRNKDYDGYFEKFKSEGVE